ncbi:MAG: hypothetical protein EOO91_08740 [Pedobacter sp.]|nr:MAG: hypothetical protein EOO91_08740 [Pedobacter sp.]
MKKQNLLTFQELLDAINTLKPEEKVKLLQILSKDDLSVVKESEAIYVKSTPIGIDFEKKWNNGLTSEEFKEKIYQHIDTLPWKQQ